MQVRSGFNGQRRKGLLAAARALEKRNHAGTSEIFRQVGGNTVSRGCGDACMFVASK